MGIRQVLALGISVMALAGSGGCARTGAVGASVASPSTSAPSVSAPPEAYHLASDGSVPWVDEPLAEKDLHPSSAPPSAPPGTSPCQAKQLSATMASWIKPDNGGETPRGFDANISHLYGYADIHNTSTSWCTLQGEVPTTMVVGTTKVPMLYTHNINDEARAKVTSVPPGGHASLRLDWGGPFCVELTGQPQLAIELPHDGGTLQAPLTATDRPACNPGAVKPTVKAALSAGAFGEAVDLRPVGQSPLQQLSAGATGPASGRPGEQVTFRVVLTNPTGAPIALEPCPAYLLELHASRDNLGEPVNVTALYLLNCRPTKEIPARAALAFQIATVVPGTMVSGRQLTISWTLMPRQQTTGEPVRAQLVLPVVS